MGGSDPFESKSALKQRSIETDIVKIDANNFFISLQRVIWVKLMAKSTPINVVKIGAGEST